MTSSTTFSRGDIALVWFVFADERGAKRRPVLVLSSDAYHGGRAEAIVAAMTSNIARLLPGDHLVGNWREAGLPKPTVATAIVRTIKQGMIERRLGTLAPGDLEAVDRALRLSLAL